MLELLSPNKIVPGVGRGASLFLLKTIVVWREIKNSMKCLNSFVWGCRCDSDIKEIYDANPVCGMIWLSIGNSFCRCNSETMTKIFVMSCILRVSGHIIFVLSYFTNEQQMRLIIWWLKHVQLQHKFDLQMFSNNFL